MDKPQMIDCLLEFCDAKTNSATTEEELALIRELIKLIGSFFG